MGRVHFWAKVVMTEGCWLWTGSTAGSRMKHGRLTPPQAEQTGERAAHRHAYALYHGSIPAGLQINHHCDVPLCVRPDHLYAGTQTENMADAKRRARGIGRPVTQVCPQGHLKTGDNLRIYSGHRFCVACMNERARNYQRRRRAQTVGGR